MPAKDETRIDEPQIKRDGRGRIEYVSVAFGPHHFVEVFVENGRVQCAIGATHHGIRADAGEVNSEFEQMVEQLKASHPGKAF